MKEAKDKIYINLENRSIGGVTTAGGFKAQMNKLKAQLRGDVNENC